MIKMMVIMIKMVRCDDQDDNEDGDNDVDVDHQVDAGTGPHLLGGRDSWPCCRHRHPQEEHQVHHHCYPPRHSLKHHQAGADKRQPHRTGQHRPESQEPRSDNLSMAKSKNQTRFRISQKLDPRAFPTSHTWPRRATCWPT